MLYTLTFLVSLLIACFAIPSLISVSLKKRLFDDPSDLRKVHKRFVPNFGGVAIFTAFLFSSSLFIPVHLIPNANILMAGGIILFMTGLKDDVVGLTPMVKFSAQLACAIITVMLADLRITDLQGIFGIHMLSYSSSILLSILFIIGVVNAYNLIDGIDGLAGTLGVIFGLMFTFLFFKSGDLGWAYLSLCLTGALVGFLFFNITPAKIFMGDSGSLLIGFIAAVLSLQFLHVSLSKTVMVGPFYIISAPSLVLAILIIPIFDTLRVFILRILSNKSPFTADSNHLHHRFLFLGLSHVQTTLILAVSNVLFIVMAFSLQQLGNTQLIGILVCTILAINGGLSLYIEREKRKGRVNAFIDAEFRSNSAAISTSEVARKATLKNISQN